MYELLKYYNLHDHPGIYLIGTNSEEEWLEERKKGIGGSDAAAVLGISKYTSPLKVYKVKLGEIKEDLSDNIYVKKGKDLEALIRNVYVVPYFQKLGYTVRHPEHMFVSAKTPWLRSNCDGLAIPNDLEGKTYTDNIVVEIKWVSEWGEFNWYGEDYCGIPAEYYAQVQHYMVTTGAKKAVVCALFDKSWEMHYFDIPFDPMFAKQLVDDTCKFYNYNLGLSIPPRVDVTLDKDETLRMISSDPVDIIKGNPEFEEAIAEYLTLKEANDREAKRVTELLKNISAMYLAGHRSEAFKMSISKCSRAGFNATRFAEDHPELYQQYIQQSEYTRTTVKRK